MQNLLTAQQMQMVDAYAIKQQKTSSINLMENASKAFVKVFVDEFKDKHLSIAVFCGKGNNGGDGLAIARLLHSDGYKNIQVFLVDFTTKQSYDNLLNLDRLLAVNLQVIKVSQPKEIENLKADIVIDAILGSGLNKPLSANYIDLARLINQANAKVIAVDVPTGFNGENQISENYNGVKADLVISFQRPKINFFMPESVLAFKKFKVVDIGLAEDFIEAQPSNFKLTTADDIKQLLKPRENFTHKGTYGHALIVAGNNTTMGAALLSASGCLHSGAGLTTVCLPQSGLMALNTLLPEVMALPQNEFENAAFEKFSAIAVGPGLGVNVANEILLTKLISLNKPMVIDADAITILSNNKELLSKLLSNTILTPHLKEFDRLFGIQENWWQRLVTAKEKAQELKIIIVLKNQYSFVCLPTGDVYINPTGNAAMASGGMGDVLTGILVSLLAQKYVPKEAAILAVYLHGKAGDELANDNFCVTASQVALQIPKTMRLLMA